MGSSITSLSGCASELQGLSGSLLSLRRFQSPELWRGRHLERSRVGLLHQIPFLGDLLGSVVVAIELLCDAEEIIFPAWHGKSFSV